MPASSRSRRNAGGRAERVDCKKNREANASANCSNDESVLGRRRLGLCFVCSNCVQHLVAWQCTTIEDAVINGCRSRSRLSGMASQAFRNVPTIPNIAERRIGVKLGHTADVANGLLCALIEWQRAPVSRRLSHQPDKRSPIESPARGTYVRVSRAP